MGQKATYRLSRHDLQPAIWIVVAILLIVSSCGGPSREPAEQVYLHRVESGETLSVIADEYYDNPQMADVIGEFNAVRDTDLRDGMVLRIPLSGEDVERIEKKERARVPYNKGLELAEKGAYVEAVQEFQESLTIEPDFVDAIYNLGVTYQKMKSYERARGELAKAVRLRPEKPEYRFAFGTCLFHLDKFGDAAGAFEGVMELDPTHARALYSLAVCYEKQGEKEKAIAAWRRYLEIDSKSAWANEARKRLKELE
ncbi:MAG: tetratricopeptide repeat protein [Candidatus Latescibacterota bacterium]|nr:MAG: tetratricopeptide repeat protein [Candidatus Latescibacterota bacterium]